MEDTRGSTAGKRGSILDSMLRSSIDQSATADKRRSGGKSIRKSGAGQKAKKGGITIEDLDSELQLVYDHDFARKFRTKIPEKITDRELTAFYTALQDNVSLSRVYQLLSVSDNGWITRERKVFLEILREICEQDATQAPLADAIVDLQDRAKEQAKGRQVGGRSHTVTETEGGRASGARQSCVSRKSGGSALGASMAMAMLADFDEGNTVIPFGIFKRLLEDKKFRRTMKIGRDSAAQKVYERMDRIEQQEVTVAACKQHVRRVVERDDAFLTLPWTVVYVTLFMLLVGNHLLIYERSQTQGALASWTIGPDPKTSLKTVTNLASYWEWVKGVGIPVVLSDCGTDKNDTITRYWIASRHVLIGGVRFACLTLDGEEYVQWLSAHPAAVAFLKANPGDHLNATLVAAAAVQADTKCGTRHAEKLKLSFVTYDEMTYTYSTTTASLWLNIYGTAEARSSTESTPMDPYPLWYVIVADCLFVLLVARIAISESISMISTARLGWGEFKEYWDLWNTVDWLSILGSCLVVALLVFDSVVMMDPELATIIDDNMRLMVDPMSLDFKTMEALYDKVVFLQQLFGATHSVMAVNTLTLLAKFFKSFQSNARLKVITDTFVAAAVDLAHFFIVFLTLFLPLVIAGHICFGNDIPAFGSLFSTLNTGITTLLGDYAWFTQGNAPTALTDQLPTGTPALLLFFWFFIFHFLITLVVLNMLLGIVLKHYVHVTHRLKVSGNAPEIWVQVNRYRKFQMDTKGFVPLATIDRGLQNDENPSIKGPQNMLISTDVLIQAFEKMSQAQAEYFLNFLQKEEFESIGGDDVTTQRVSTEDIKEAVEEAGVGAFTMLDEIKDWEEIMKSKLGSAATVMQSMKSECQKLAKQLKELDARAIAKDKLAPQKTAPVKTEEKPKASVHLSEETGKTKAGKAKKSKDGHAGAKEFGKANTHEGTTSPEKKKKGSGHGHT